MWPSLGYRSFKVYRPPVTAGSPCNHSAKLLPIEWWSSNCLCGINVCRDQALGKKSTLPHSFLDSNTLFKTSTYFRHPYMHRIGIFVTPSTKQLVTTGDSEICRGVWSHPASRRAGLMKKIGPFKYGKVCSRFLWMNTVQAVPAGLELSGYNLGNFIFERIAHTSPGKWTAVKYQVSTLSNRPVERRNRQQNNWFTEKLIRHKQMGRLLKKQICRVQRPMKPTGQWQ